MLEARVSWITRRTSSIVRAALAVVGTDTAGGGSSFGALYFKNSVGLAQKKVEDGGIQGTGFKDTRNGTKGLQY